MHIPVECDLVAHQPPHVEDHAAGDAQLGGVVGAVPEGRRVLSILANNDSALVP